MITASRIGAAFGVGVLGFVLLSGSALASPDNGKAADNGAGHAATATAVASAGEPGDGATDAHPGHTERQLEKGGSGTQGTSMSNPDGPPGVDKPYAAAGYAAKTQQGDYGGAAVNANDFDGNNGCGNDTDFADDNNGNCGGNKPAPPVKPPVKPPVTPPVTPPVAPTSGGGGVAPTVISGAVLGLQIERPAPAAVRSLQAPATLAATGGSIALEVAMAIALIGTGAGVRRLARPRS